MPNITPNLNELIQNSYTLQKNEELRLSVEENLPNLSPAKKAQLTQTLLMEQNQLTQIQTERDQALQKLNEETLIKGKALLAKANRVVREEKEGQQEIIDDTTAEQLLSDL